MSNRPPNTNTAQDHEHGTMQSYIVGFLLSLVFTFIPYYLVVNQTVSGTTLLVTILAFAVLQMIIQVTFFLHLGRGPKPDWNLFFFIATVGIILVVVGGSIMIMNNLYHNMMPADQTKKLVGDEGIYQIGGEKTGACQGVKASHKITIKNNQADPSHIIAHICDSLTFINEDDEAREITFGTHPEHGVYAGETELIVRKGRPKSVTLSETGTYRFHDHLQPDIAGVFTVAE
jgi:cytochrome o ubiquinol oxidase subunit IV